MINFPLFFIMATLYVNMYDNEHDKNNRRTPSTE